MSMREIVKDSEDQSVVIRIIDSTTGLPEQAVEHDTGGIAMWYRREGGTKQTVATAALAALDTAHTDGGIEHIDDGYYRFDIPDAAAATGANGVMVGGAVTDMIVIGTYTPLVVFDIYGVPQVDLTHVMGTILTEGAGGRLAAAFIKLFDVATPLLVASDAMRGTNSGATAAKLLAFVQLLARGDAAIVTDNATELAQINADGGTGAGGYSPTKESQEGIKDRGDLEWITAIGFNIVTPDAAGIAAGLHATTDGLIGSLNDPTTAAIATAVLGSAIDTGLDMTKALKVILALKIAKKVTVSGADYLYQDQDGNTLVTITFGAGSSTAVIA